MSPVLGRTGAPFFVSIMAGTQYAVRFIVPPRQGEVPGGGGGAGVFGGLRRGRAFDRGGGGVAAAATAASGDDRGSSEAEDEAKMPGKCAREHFDSHCVPAPETGGPNVELASGWAAL